MWALVRLIIADAHDREIMRDTRDAIWCAYGIKRKGDEEKEAMAAVDAAEKLLNMFPTEGETQE